MGSTQAQDEYGGLLDTFIKYSANEPGTHVSEVALPNLLCWNEVTYI